MHRLVCIVTLAALCVSSASARFEFEDAAKTINMEKYKNVPNPPIYEQPLGACEVPNLSFSRLRKELKKRLVVCDTCKTKEDFRVALRDAITSFKPVMSDEDYERYLVYEQTDEGKAEIAAAAEERAAAAAIGDSVGGESMQSDL